MSEPSSESSSCSNCSFDFVNPCTHRSQPKESYINPVARVLLAAVLLPSQKSPFSLLSKCPDLVEIIYQHLKTAWAACLVPGYDCDNITRYGNLSSFTSQPPRDLSHLALCRLASGITFPEPRGLMCNMLPFLAHDLDTIPSEYHGYLPIIRECRRYLRDPGRVWYLTIHESEIHARGPQRRGGIHVEGFLARPARSIEVPLWHHWGMGLGNAEFTGGIFQGSNVGHSCRMWNVQIPRSASPALGLGCDVEHLRSVLDDCVMPVCPRAGELFWMTDATPHESLPLEKGSYRQYFRLVTSQVSAWWEQHSTENRLGVQPDCRILRHNKFVNDAYVGFDDVRDSSHGPQIS